MIRKICLLILFIFQLSFSQDNLPPEIFSEGNEFYCPLSEQAIVTFFDITDPDDESIEALYIQISQGYVQGEDVLIYWVIISTTKSNIINSWYYICI